jgi:hypothetical protein
MAAAGTVWSVAGWRQGEMGMGMETRVAEEGLVLETASLEEHGNLLALLQRTLSNGAHTPFHWYSLPLPIQ